ncbi:nuclease HARBI1 [Trichonephila clavata]|uniref:Nuclease HARBI1 n=1 Tax=Trichonephila clavata TaxID=2740835 RepID=A0A8X6H1T4_TRICU|nr:nuclease HARBI1 [Trichonephila clavata]
MDDCFDFFLLEDLETLERRSIFIPEHRNNDLNKLDEDDFRRRYRFYKGTIETLVELRCTKLDSATSRNHALTAAEKVLAAIRFFAFGNRQINVGDLHSISQPSTSRAITDVARAFAELRPQYIYLPQTEDQRMQDFSKSNDIATKYNAAHARARNVIERQYGVWKKRFSCIDTPFRCSLETAQTAIVATAVLHNLALSLGDYD